ncbi:hypothetical protein BDN71DRAFT_530224 [Pleurotus eryngii]|uniref:Uncharacterized protein n=1 Tax=Pleurotus eryngii TaxID=5323 RepID=A0A9P6DHB9_PLEER|nr:hypothetical protein BDN71DRAFT_530224 [Pleurotus eryngii]
MLVLLCGCCPINLVVRIRRMERHTIMFNNNGNSTYTFKAQYSNGFGLDRFQQHQLQDSSGVDFSIDYKDYYVNIEFGMLWS